MEQRPEKKTEKFQKQRDDLSVLSRAADPSDISKSNEPSPFSLSVFQHLTKTHYTFCPFFLHCDKGTTEGTLGRLPSKTTLLYQQAFKTQGTQLAEHEDLKVDEN